MDDHKAFVREYIGVIEAGAIGDALARFFNDDVVQEEFPNRLMPAGATRNLAAILEGVERGQQVMMENGRIHRQRNYDCFDAF